jgi:hypothetical protein
LTVKVLSNPTISPADGDQPQRDWAAQLSNAVRVLVPMVCPDLASRPCEQEVIKVLATPALAAGLKHVAGG